MELTSRRSLSAFQRGIVRQAVSKHPSWDSWRSNVFCPAGKPVNTSTISVPQLYDAADAFGIDIDETLANANAGERSERAERAERSERKPIASDEASQLASILQSILSKPQIDESAVRAIVDECLESAAPTVDESTVQAMVDKALESKQLPITVQVVKHDSSTVKLQGHHHPMFPKLLKAVASGIGAPKPVNVWLTGPAGSGKTHAARQVATALTEMLGREIPFYSHGGLSMEHQLLGFIRPGDGVYQSTDFRQAYEYGGVCLLDEIDNYDPSMSLVANAPLANGHGSFPDVLGGVKRHPDCFIIAAANTWGSGPTAEYVGRNRLDGAFLDRFIKIHWDYDEVLERRIAGNDAWVDRVQAARRKARERGLHILITPRASQDGAILIAGGFTSDEAADMTYLATLDKSQREALES
jgi:cobaltochelatase CobS